MYTLFIGANSPKPVQCKPNEPFSVVIQNYNCDSIEVEESKTVKISRVKAKTLSVVAKYTEIKNSSFKTINVKGDLFLHDCPNLIDKVTVTGKLILFKCYIQNVFAGDNLDIIHEEEQTSYYSHLSSGKSINQTFLVSKPKEIFVYHDCAIRGTTYLDENIKTVIIKGDCSQMGGFHFKGDKYSPEERKVIVSPGAKFNGKVAGGTLIYASVP